MSDTQSPGEAEVALLADPTRRRIVALVALRPRRPAELADELPSSLGAVLRELELMADAGLLRSQRSPVHGRGRRYAIEPANHGAITAWLAGAGHETAPPPAGTGAPRGAVGRDGRASRRRASGGTREPPR